jgi:hypothetical protein
MHVEATLRTFHRPAIRWQATAAQGRRGCGRSAPLTFPSSIEDPNMKTTRIALALGLALGATTAFAAPPATSATAATSATPAASSGTPAPTSAKTTHVRHHRHHRLHKKAAASDATGTDKTN